MDNLESHNNQLSQQRCTSSYIKDKLIDKPISVRVKEQEDSVEHSKRRAHCYNDSAYASASVLYG